MGGSRGLVCVVQARLNGTDWYRGLLDDGLVDDGLGRGGQVFGGLVVASQRFQSQLPGFHTRFAQHDRTPMQLIADRGKLQSVDEVAVQPRLCRGLGDEARLFFPGPWCWGGGGRNGLHWKWGV